MIIDFGDAANAFLINFRGHLNDELKPETLSILAARLGFDPALFDHTMATGLVMFRTAEGDARVGGRSYPEYDQIFGAQAMVGAVNRALDVREA